MAKAKMFKLFQRNKQHVTDRSKGFVVEDDDSGVVDDPGPDKTPEKQQPASTNPGRKKKKGRWFGIRGNKNRNSRKDLLEEQPEAGPLSEQHAEHEKQNETFMTAETEGSNDDNGLKQLTLELFPDLRSSAADPGTSNNMESWKDLLVSDDAESGVEASVNHKDAAYDSIDGGLIDDLFSGMDLMPFDEADLARAVPQDSPRKIDAFDLLKQRAGVLSACDPSDSLPTMEPPFFPAFSAFEETSDIAGFLSADQERSMGTPTRVPVSLQQKTANPAAVILQSSLAVSLGNDGTSSHPSNENDSTNDSLLQRSLTDASSLMGSRFAEGDDPEDDPIEEECDRIVDATDSSEQQVFRIKEEPPMEPSIETRIAAQSQASFTSESQSESVVISVSDPQVAEAKSEAPQRDSESSVSALSPPRLRPPPPPPPRASPKQHVAASLVDDEDKVEELCETSVSSGTTSKDSVKTENDLLHHFHNANASPDSWSAIKSSMSAVVSADLSLEPPGSYVSDRFEGPAYQERVASIFEELERLTQPGPFDENEPQLSPEGFERKLSSSAQMERASSTGYETAASIPDELGPRFATSQDEDKGVDPISPSIPRTQDQIPSKDEEVEEEQRNVQIIVTSSVPSSPEQTMEAGKSAGNKKSGLVKRALSNLSTGGSMAVSHLSAIPEQTAYSDFIIPARNNYRKLCTKLIHHAITDRKGKPKSLKVEREAVSMTDDESSCQEAPVSRQDETTALAQSSRVSDIAEPDDASKQCYHQSPKLTHQTTLKRVHFMSDLVSSDEDVVQPGNPIQEGTASANPAMDNDSNRPKPSFDELPSRQNKCYTREDKFQVETQVDNVVADNDSVGAEDLARGDVEERLAKDDTVEEATKSSVHQVLSSDDDAHTLESEFAASQYTEDEESYEPLDFKQRTKELAKERKKWKSSRREKSSRDDGIKVPGLAFLDNTLDRLAGNLDCSFFSASAEGHGSDDESGFGCEDESIVTFDDEGTYETYESRDRGRLQIEEDVEEALKWADEHIFRCGQDQ